LSAYAVVQKTLIDGRVLFDREKDLAGRAALEQEKKDLLEKAKKSAEKKAEEKKAEEKKPEEKKPAEKKPEEKKPEEKPKPPQEQLAAGGAR
jgi:outer membrane biosynthesis protein TonB